MSFKSMVVLLLFVLMVYGCSKEKADTITSARSDTQTNSSKAHFGAFSLDKKKMVFFANINELKVAPQIIHASVENADSDIYIDASIDRPNVIFDYRVVNDSGLPHSITLAPVAPDYIGPGAHRTSMKIRACRDAQCESEYGGSPQIVDIQYVVKAPDFSIDKKELVFMHSKYSAFPRPQQVTLSSKEAWNIFGYTKDGVPHWLEISQKKNDNTNTVTTTFSILQSMPAGRYNAKIGLFLHDPSVAREVDISFIVKEPVLEASQRYVSFVVDKDADTDEQRKSVNIFDNLPSSVDWIAETKAEWLTITPDKGKTDSSTDVVLSLNKKIKKLGVGNYEAVITIRDKDNKLDPYQIHVALAKQVDPVPEPKSRCLEKPGIIFINCESNEWYGFSAWDIIHNSGMYVKDYDYFMPGNGIVDWRLLYAGHDHGHVIDVRYKETDQKAMFRMYTVEGVEKSIDKSDYLNGTINFQVRVMDWGAVKNGMEFKLECIWPCESKSSALKIDQLNEWYNFSFGIKDLINSGFDLSKVEMGFQIFPAWEGGAMGGIHFQLDNIEWKK